MPPRTPRTRAAVAYRHRPVTPRWPATTLACIDGAFTLTVLAGAAGFAHVLLTPLESRLPAVVAALGAWLLGAVVLRLYPQRYRVQGFLPWAALAGLALAAPKAALPPDPDAEALSAWGWLTLVALAVLLGLAAGSILRTRDHLRANLGRFTGAAALGVALSVLVWRLCEPAQLAWVCAAALLALAVLGWAALARPAVEVAIEPFLRLMYTVEAVGEGRKLLPLHGPCLVMANHAAWSDPLLLAEAIPRETAPMMTAGFYDLPVVRPLMRHVFRTIRVHEQAVRRDAPEILDAVAALDAGQCVVIFPEGYLRRTEAVPLRRFGQGVWQILAARPSTPVVATWIEGSWGSYFSHKDGPPTKNKRFDRRLRIRVAFLAPVTVPLELLADGRHARAWLANRVLDARMLLGLPPLPPVVVPADSTEGGDAGETGDEAA